MQMFSPLIGCKMYTKIKSLLKLTVFRLFISFYTYKCFAYAVCAPCANVVSAMSVSEYKVRSPKTGVRDGYDQLGVLGIEPESSLCKSN